MPLSVLKSNLIIESIISEITMYMIPRGKQVLSIEHRPEI